MRIFLKLSNLLLNLFVYRSNVDGEWALLHDRHGDKHGLVYKDGHDERHLQTREIPTLQQMHTEKWEWRDIL